MKHDIDLLVLLKKVKSLQKNAYVPYSLFRVAALVTLKNNKEVWGVNVENAAYSVAICAERAALSQVFAQGYTKADIVSLFLITDSDTIGTPCGTCRQFMIETMAETCPVYISNKNENNDTKTIYQVLVKDLLPLPFKSNSLQGG